MKLFSAFIAILVIALSFAYFANTSIASTATITYITPVGTLFGPPSNIYELSSSTGSRFDVQLNTNSTFTGTMLENLSNQQDANGNKADIQITSSVLSSLSSGTYYWRAKVHDDDSFTSSSSFVIP